MSELVDRPARARRRRRELPPALLSLAVVVTLLGLAAILYFGRVVFVPLTLAAILSFLLAPAMRATEALGVPRLPACIVVVGLAVAAIGGIAAVMGQQVADLAADLPKYETTIRAKIAGARSFASGGGGLAKAVDIVKGLAEDSLATAGSITGQADGARAGRSEPPTPVEVAPARSDPFTEFYELAVPVLHPLATFGLIVIFAGFVLVQREDLRNRFITLAGTGDLLKTTAAIDDAADRLSCLFLAQLAINTSYGVLIGIGLWLIGVPSPILWAILAGLLRFIPFIGATMGAVPPILLAVGIDPGWSMLLWSLALFIAVDVTLGQILEPLFYGHSTGISPVAVLVATAIWTFLWGPIGIFLAMPLTVCIVVLGRHVERLRFLDTLLGDRPVLKPHEIFYQRMLAGHGRIALVKARETLRERALVTYYDEVVRPGVALALRDVARDELGGDRLADLRSAVQKFVVEIGTDVPARGGPVSRLHGAAHDPEAVAAVEALGPDHAVASEMRRPAELDPAWRGPVPILILPGDGCMDEVLSLMLAQILTQHGLGARLDREPDIRAERHRPPVLLCLSGAGRRDLGRTFPAIEEARAARPDLAVMVCLWDVADGTGGPRRPPGEDAPVLSYHEALTEALRLSSGEDRAGTSDRERQLRQAR